MGDSEGLGILVLIIAVIVIGAIALVTWSTPKGTGLAEWGASPEKPIETNPFNIPTNYSLFFVIGILVLIIAYTGARTMWSED